MPLILITYIDLIDRGQFLDIWSSHSFEWTKYKTKMWLNINFQAMFQPCTYVVGAKMFGWLICYISLYHAPKDWDIAPYTSCLYFSFAPINTTQCNIAMWKIERCYMYVEINTTQQNEWVFCCVELCWSTPGDCCDCASTGTNWMKLEQKSYLNSVELSHVSRCKGVKPTE